MGMLIDNPFTFHGDRKGTGFFFEKPFTVVEHLDTNEIEVQGDFKEAEKDYLIVAYLSTISNYKMKKYKKMNNQKL